MLRKQMDQCMKGGVGLASYIDHTPSLSSVYIGSSSWIDFLNPDNRRWWSERFALDNYEVIIGLITN